MAETDQDASVKVVIPNSRPLPSHVEGIAGTLELLARDIRKGEIFGFTLVWMGGSTLQLIKSPETPPKNSDDVPVPDMNDPKEQRRAEVSAYFEGLFMALKENKQWSPKIGDRIKSEMPGVWEAIHQKGTAADEEQRRYVEGEVTDPEVHKKAINAMGDAWRDAFTKLEELDKARPATNGSALPGGEYPF